MATQFGSDEKHHTVIPLWLVCQCSQ